MTGRNTRSIVIVLGAVVALIGLLLVWGGLTPLSQHRDADGYLLSDPLTVDRSARAVITNDVELLRGHYECAGEETFFLAFYSPDDVRMRGITSGSDALFMGIAPADAIEGYLDGVAHDEITEWECDVDDIVAVEYTRHKGTAAPDAPGTEQFWVTSTSGTGQQTLDWTIESGEWAMVVMNADASSGVSADLRFGALAPSGLDTLAWTSLAVGLVALIGGGLLMYRGLRRQDRDSTSLPTDLPGEQSAPQTERPLERTAPGAEPLQPRPGAWSTRKNQTGGD
jgi:hypothetical protein